MDFQSEINLQPHLRNDLVIIEPLRQSDFERLYAVASDPLIWEQHPSRDRYKKEVFEKFFEEAINSQTAFIILDAETNEVVGSSRYHDIDIDKKVTGIGY